MSTTNPRQTKAKGNGANTTELFPFQEFYQNDLLWSPYRSMLKFWLQSQRSAMAALQVNRKFADELRYIIRHEQDVMDDVFERTLQRLSADDKSPAEAGSLASESWTKIYEATVEGVRECGKAMTEAQEKSMEIMRERAGTVDQSVRHSFQERKAA